MGFGCSISPNSGKRNEALLKIKEGTDQTPEPTQQSGGAKEGQPGQIKLNGASLKDNPKIKITAASEQIVFSDQVEVKAEQSIEKLNVSKEYINIGCKDFDKSLLNGLTELKLDSQSKELLTASARVVIICGEVQLQHKFVSLTADQIVLFNVHYSMKQDIGTISLQTKDVTLMGENLISVSSASPATPGPTIELTVAKNISGEGTLQLVSAPAEKAPEVKESQPTK